MSAKDVKFSVEARTKMLRGIDILAAAVKVTLVPTTDGLAELDNTVLLVAVLTTCDNALLVDVLFVASPL